VYRCYTYLLQWCNTYLRRDLMGETCELERQAVAAITGALAGRGWSQSDLARELGVSSAAVSNVLAGHTSRGMTLARLERWMAVLGWRVVLETELVVS
jgi:ribosome-binding protein aMBF1 (putative translation factor)